MNIMFLVCLYVIVVISCAMFARIKYDKDKFFYFEIRENYLDYFLRYSKWPIATTTIITIFYFLIKNIPHLL